MPEKGEIGDILISLDVVMSMNLPGNAVWKKILRILLVISSLVNLVFCWMVIYYKRLNLELLAKFWESQSVLVEVFTRYATLWFYHSQFMEILHMHRYFWDPKIFDEDLQKETAKFRRIAIMGFKIIYTCGGFSIISLLIMTLIFGDMPFEIYVHDGKYNFALLYIVQVFYLFLCLHLFAGFDSLFLTLCMNVVVQLKLLKNRLENVDLRQEMEMKRCVEYHRFLMRYFVKIKKVYSVYILLQVLNYSSLICMEAYILIEGKGNPWKLTRNGLVASMHLLQLCMYCYPGSEVTKHSLEIGEGMYNNKWYLVSNQKTKIYVMSVIRRSQNPFQLSLAGLATLSMETLTSAFNFGISCLTMIRSIRKD